MLNSFFENISATKRQYQIYLVFYILWGFCMNAIGKWLQIAEFVYWWQVLSCYGLYLLPASLLVRKLSVFQQYRYGLLVLAPLELVGYSIGTSHAFDNNIVDQIFGERNFTLAMVIFFGWSLPVGNKIVAWIEQTFFGKTKRWV